MYIYCITSKANNKKYIGSTNNVDRRWREHYLDAYNENKSDYNYPLQRAIRKYKIENFIFEIIENCSIENVAEREKYWIIELNTLARNDSGYNQSIDTVCAMRDPEIQKQCDYKNQQVVGISLTDVQDRVYYNSIKEASEKEKIGRAGISGCINGNPKYSHSGGRVWRKVEDEDTLLELMINGKVIVDGKSNYSKKIATINEKNEVLQIFLSRVDAAKWLVDNNYAKGEVKNIAAYLSKAIKENKRVYKFLWKDLNERNDLNV